jgi:hypothetical protein
MPPRFRASALPEMPCSRALVDKRYGVWRLKRGAKSSRLSFAQAGAMGRVPERQSVVSTCIGINPKTWTPTGSEGSKVSRDKCI